MELAFVVGNYQQVDMMFPVAVLRSVEWKDFGVFKNQNVDADGWIYVLELGVSENLRGNCSPAMTSSLK